MFIVRRLVLESRLTSPITNIRTLRNRKLGADPGIRRRTALLNVESNEEIPDFEDMETDFMEVNKSYNDHLADVTSQKQREKFLIVRQKYFKEKFPNFLTWHDKEQIRYLHTQDPDEWTIDRLSEGFPALPEVIRKIVKTRWSKTSQNKIKNHDTSVCNNWKLFKDGRMNDLPRELIEHLQKFTDRSLNLTPFEAPVPLKPVIDIKKKNKSDFSNIIQSYIESKKDVKQEETINKKLIEIESPPPINNFNRRRPTTLNELRKNLTKKVEEGKYVDVEEDNIVQHFTSENQVEVAAPQTNIIDIPPAKYETTNTVQFYKKREKDLSHLQYPDVITIPKALFKKGYIYKLNDCFYDHDGEFLYRVPGMY